MYSRTHVRMYTHKHGPKPYTHLASFNEATSARYPRGPGKVPMLVAATKESPGLIRPDASIGPGAKSKPVTTMPWVVVVVLLLLLELPLGSLFGKMVDGGSGRQRLTRARRRSDGVAAKRTSKSVELHSSNESGGASGPEAAMVAAFFSS